MTSMGDKLQICRMTRRAAVAWRQKSRRGRIAILVILIVIVFLGNGAYDGMTRIVK